MRRLRFYFDYISHNAYLAWVSLPALAQRHALEVEPIPVLFAGLLGANGQLGPAEIPPKLHWMNRDVLRKAARLGIPLSPPAHHPFNPLAALRVSSVPLEPEQRKRLIDALFVATWAQGRAVGESGVVAQVLDEAGFDGASLQSAATGEHKGRLRDQTDAAIAAGVFGVPTMEVEGELFWGFDDFDHLELFLRGEDPLREDEFAAWLEVRPAAQRKRP